MISSLSDVESQSITSESIDNQKVLAVDLNSCFYWSKCITSLSEEHCLCFIVTHERQSAYNYFPNDENAITSRLLTVKHSFMNTQAIYEPVLCGLPHLTWLRLTDPASAFSGITENHSLVKFINVTTQIFSVVTFISFFLLGTVYLAMSEYLNTGNAVVI